jgi:hypothetical protein
VATDGAVHGAREGQTGPVRVGVGVTSARKQNRRRRPGASSGQEPGVGTTRRRTEPDGSCVFLGAGRQQMERRDGDGGGRA